MTSCGAELAEDAVVPETLARLMRHVALNMVAHAEWVGAASEPARAEQSGLRRVAEAYQSIATAAEQAARTMRELHDLKEAPHDLGTWDRQQFVGWMRRKIELQREFAELVLAHAQASERVLAE